MTLELSKKSDAGVYGMPKTRVLGAPQTPASGFLKPVQAFSTDF